VIVATKKKSKKTRRKKVAEKNGKKWLSILYIVVVGLLLMGAAVYALFRFLDSVLRMLVMIKEFFLLYYPYFVLGALLLLIAIGVMRSYIKRQE